MTDHDIIEEFARITDDLHSLVFSLNLVRREIARRVTMGWPLIGTFDDELSRSGCTTFWLIEVHLGR